MEEINLKSARLEVDSKIEDLQTRVSTSFSSNKKKSLSLSRNGKIKLKYDMVEFIRYERI